MTRSRYRIYEDYYPYFLTCTIVGWLPVFTRPEAAQIVFDCWRFLRSNKNLTLYGYVLLENHLHLIASAPDLANVMKSFKMYTARQILDLLKRHGAHVLLRQLRAQAGAQDEEHLPGLARGQQSAPDSRPGDNAPEAGIHPPESRQAGLRRGRASLALFQRAQLRG